MNNTLDERDSAILTERQTALDANPNPKVGDWVWNAGSAAPQPHPSTVVVKPGRNSQD